MLPLYDCYTRTAIIYYVRCTDVWEKVCFFSEFIITIVLPRFFVHVDRQICLSGQYCGSSRVDGL